MVFREGYWKHGRFYGSWRRDLYLFPIDEVYTSSAKLTFDMCANDTSSQEEMRRLDIFHKFFLLARRNCAFSYPIQRSVPTSILDLGTGTGIWAIYVAEEYVLLKDVAEERLVLIQFKNPSKGPCHGGGSK